MISLVLAVLVFVAAGLGIGLGWRLGRKGAAAELAESRRRSEAQLVEQRRHLDEAFQRALHLVRAERGESLQAALDNVLSVASSTFGDQLAAGKLVIERERDTVSVQVRVREGNRERTRFFG